MPEWLHEGATELASQRGISLNQLIVEALEAVVQSSTITGPEDAPNSVAQFLLEFGFFLDSEDADDFILLARERATEALVRTGAHEIQTRSLRVVPTSRV